MIHPPLIFETISAEGGGEALRILLIVFANERSDCWSLLIHDGVSSEIDQYFAEKAYQKPLQTKNSTLDFL